MRLFQRKKLIIFIVPTKPKPKHRDAVARALADLPEIDPTPPVNARAERLSNKANRDCRRRKPVTKPRRKDRFTISIGGNYR